MVNGNKFIFQNTKSNLIVLYIITAIKVAKAAPTIP